MDTGANTDVYLARVNWLPDSRSVAIQRLNRAQTQLDLLFCDAATGASKTILTETDKYWINISDDLYFFSDNKRFLWSSERTGYRHFYLYENSGKQLAQLTHGDWAISDLGGFGPGSANHPAVDEKHGYIYFLRTRTTSAKRSSIASRSAINPSRASRKKAARTPSNIAPDAVTFIDSYSNVATPPRQDLERIDGTRVAVVNEDKIAELAEYRLSPVEFVEVSADDGTQLNASIIKPPDFDPAKKYPVLVSVYGGPHVQVVRNAWGGAGYLWHEILAEKGYIIFSLDNRGSWGRGHAFETPIYHHWARSNCRTSSRA